MQQSLISGVITPPICTRIIAFVSGRITFLIKRDQCKVSGFGSAKITVPAIIDADTVAKNVRVGTITEALNVKIPSSNAVVPLKLPMHTSLRKPGPQLRT